MSDSIVTTISVEEMANLVQEYGFQARIEHDPELGPRIRSGASGFKFSILFYNKLEGGDRYSQAQFRFAISVHPKPNFETINAWNRDWRYPKAYLDRDGDPCLELDLMLGGGVSPAWIGDELERWQTALYRYYRTLQEANESRE